MSQKEKDSGKLACESGQVSLPPELQGKLGKRLRDSYSDLVNQPIPDKFLVLLEQLKSAEPPKAEPPKEGK